MMIGRATDDSIIPEEEEKATQTQDDENANLNLDEVLKKYVHENFFSPNNFVYHYTRPENINTIINCGYLKFNPHPYLNKKNRANKELQVGSDIIRKILCKSAPLRHLVPRFNGYMNKGLTVFTVSFCQEERSSYVMKNYGSSYIEFRAEFLKQFIINNRSCFFGTVKYNKQQQEKIIREMFDLYEEHKKNSNEPEVDLFTLLTVILPLLKDECSHIEDECRVVGAEIKYNGILVPPECPKELRFRASNIKVYKQ